jgi:hypothetical protein
MQSFVKIKKYERIGVDCSDFRNKNICKSIGKYICNIWRRCK